MRVNEDFIYFKKNEDISTILQLEEKNFADALEAIYAVIEWSSIEFPDLFNGLEVQVTDIPIVETIAFMGIEEVQKTILIYLNLAAIIKSYEEKTYMEDFIFEEEKTCAEFVVFVFLHELGHLYWAMKGQEGKSLVEMVETYIKEVQHEYELFEAENKEWLERQKEKELTKEEEYLLKYKYRKIPSEEKADDFAKKHFDNINCR